MGSGILVFHLFFALEKDVNSEFFDEMNKKVGLQIEQDLVFENLEESIVILEDKKLELLNDNFINQFKNHLKKYVQKNPKIEEEENNKKLSTMKKRIKGFLNYLTCRK